ncbi:glycerol-3-phosphate 1-O-acyltransferase PlsY [bacterium]|nr:glycerol-3-phosphate 1-O-acyltransferase PlsY [bacterium]
MDWKPIVLPLLAYLLGSFPTGVVLSRRKFGIDVREMGSGNMGATNVLRNFGWKAGLATFLIDGLKGYLAVALTQAWGVPELTLITALAVVIGHCFPIFLGFRGGKGVATTMGCFFAVSPGLGIWMAVAYVGALWASRISAIGSLVGVFVACLYATVHPGAAPYRTLVYAVSGVVWLRHYSNIRRLIQKRPAH